MEQFHNAGVVQKDTTTGTTTFIYFNNTGTVHAESGTINFTHGSDLGGTFQADSGAAINFNAGSFVLSSAPNFQGPGLVQITGGNVAVTGTLTNLSLSNVNLSGLSNLVGTASLVNCSFNTSETIGCTIHWAGGTLNGGSSLSVATNGVLNIEGTVYLYGALTNAGTVYWQGGQINVAKNSGVNYTGEIWNQAGAVWDIQSDQFMVA